MRTAFRGSFPKPTSMESLVILGRESCPCGGAEKNGLWSVWLFVQQFLRSTALGGARSVLRSDANLLGVGDAQSGLRQMPSRERRTVGLAGGQSVLHQTVRLLRRSPMSRLHDQGRSRRTAFGLEDGQGVGQAVYARAGAPGRLPRPTGDRHRRSLDPQGAYLPDRGERFAAPKAHLVWRPGPFGSQHGGVLPVAGSRKTRPLATLRKPQFCSTNFTLCGIWERLWITSARANTPD